MKITRKLLGILLALTMIAGLAAACSDGDDSGAPATPTTAPSSGANEGTESETVKPDDGPVTIRVMQWALDNQSTDFENLWFFKQIEEMTGVKVEWTVVKESEWKEKLNLTFASISDLPDVILRPDKSLSIEEYGVVQEMLLPLDDYIDQYMPTYASLLEYNDMRGPDSTLRASDGKMYYLGYLITQNINHNSHFFINKTWLDAVDMAVPTTVDELTEVLLAFRDNKVGADGMYGLSAGGGLEHQTNGIYPYFGMFGVPLTRWVHAVVTDDYKVEFPGYMDGFREACEWLNMCYAEGLLDPDALTQDENAWNAKVNADQVGFQVYLRLINSAWANPDTTQNWQSILPPATSRGALVPRELELPEFGAVVTFAAEDKIESVLKWLDAQFETEWMMTAANGPTEALMTEELEAILGDDLQEGGAPLRLVDGKYEPFVPDNNALYKIVPVTQGQFFAPGDFYFEIYNMPPHRIERRDYSVEYQAAGIVEKNSYKILTDILKPDSDDASELAILGTDIESLMKTSISSFIINGVTDESWDTFMSEIDNVGIGRYLEIYQKYLDEYTANR